ncbi:MAG: sulfatase-like hydrolase/transferase, partial [Gemmatimonadota bacterium]
RRAVGAGAGGARPRRGRTPGRAARAAGMVTRVGCRAMLTLACFGSGGLVAGDAVPAVTLDRPSFLIILTDDQRAADVERAMPLTFARLHGEGVIFTRGYATTPLCCPSRSSLLTGRYARHHGVHTNGDPLRLPTIVDALHAAGYRTGLIGKYLNSWNGTPRPEFDRWVHGLAYRNPVFNVDGRSVRYQGHVLDGLQHHALAFFDASATEPNRPFFLLFSPRVPHLPAVPQPADSGRFLEPAMPAMSVEADLSDKPAWIRRLPRLAPRRDAQLREEHRRMLQAAAGLDRVIGAMLDRLAAQGRLDSTVVIFLSDNGWLAGEHRYRGKGVVYEEATRVPFALRYPPLVPSPRTEERLVANIDIAPTLYELAGLPIPDGVDGRSLATLLRGGAWRDALLLEGWRGAGPPWTAIHTGRYVYVETRNERAELYDLATDPAQHDNVAGEPAQADRVAALRVRLQGFK